MLSGLATVPQEHFSAGSGLVSSCLRTNTRISCRMSDFLGVCVCCIRVNVNVIPKVSEARMHAYLFAYSETECVALVASQMGVKKRHIQTSLQEAQATLSDFVGTQVTGRDGIVKRRYFLKGGNAYFFALNEGFCPCPAWCPVR